LAEQTINPLGEEKVKTLQNQYITGIPVVHKSEGTIPGPVFTIGKLDYVDKALRFV
jgi:hypothetical protein